MNLKTAFASALLMFSGLATVLAQTETAPTLQSEADQETVSQGFWLEAEVEAVSRSYNRGKRKLYEDAKLAIDLGLNYRKSKNGTRYYLDADYERASRRYSFNDRKFLAELGLERKLALFGSRYRAALKPVLRYEEKFDDDDRVKNVLGGFKIKHAGKAYAQNDHEIVLEPQIGLLFGTNTAAQNDDLQGESRLEASMRISWNHEWRENLEGELYVLPSAFYRMHQPGSKDFYHTEVGYLLTYRLSRSNDLSLIAGVVYENGSEEPEFDPKTRVNLIIGLSGKYPL